MAASWNVLVVDDEDDVQSVTRLALRRRSWRGRAISLTSAKTGAEARRILQSPEGKSFHCALVDVVMETDDAGLVLCDYIRSSLPRTIRIVLRTGQPGVAPAERVLNDYDIDYYLAKAEVTEERLFGALRACFRSSLDIAELGAIASQLRAFTLALQEPATTRATLSAIMSDSLQFLEDKYAAKIVFVHDVEAVAKSSESSDDFSSAARTAIVEAHARNLAPMRLHPGREVGLGPETFVVPTTALASVSRVEGMGKRFKRWVKNVFDAEENESRSGLAVTFEQPPGAKAQREFLQDAELFVGNWRLAESSLSLQDRLLRERLEGFKNYGQV